MPATAKKTKQPQPTTRTFNAEIASVLNLMIHALYTNRDIFLRELISNASDACDKLRYLALSDAKLLGDTPDLQIDIAFNKDAGTITIADSGIGMNEDDLDANLGTIARSGTREFLEKSKQSGMTSAELIGQFGVGFYSAFMIASRVEVRTRKAGENEGWLWISDGAGEYSITPCDKPTRGTEITLFVKDDAKEYLDSYKLEFIAKAYSDHISFPIFITDAEGTRKQVNAASAIWARPKSEVTPEQTQEFYRHCAHMPGEPFLTLHTHAEGTLEYSSLLFVPSMKPMDLFTPERRTRVKLYVKRVFITEESVEVIPPYLRFLRGVIDSADLPLNISRETLQKNPLLGKIRDSITSKVLSELKKKAEAEPEAYAKFWGNFGAVLKEGLCEATSPKDKIFDVCRFYSSTSDGKLVSLAEYQSRMKEGQEAIYFLTGDSAQSLAKNPHLEGFRAKGIEVLLLTDHVDDFWTTLNQNYQGIAFKSVTRSGDALNDDAADKQDSQAMQPLLDAMKTLYGDQVRDVRITSKLTESPCCLAVEEGDMDARMERFLIDHQQLSARRAKILEINPRHPVFQACAAKVTFGALDDETSEILWLMLDQARLLEGEPLPDMQAFLSRLNKRLVV